MNLTTNSEEEDARHFFVKGLKDSAHLEDLFTEQDSLVKCFTIALKHSKKMRVPIKKGARSLTTREPVLK